MKNNFDANPESPFDHPEGRKLKQTADEALSVLSPLLSQTSDLLTQAERILSEFKPSGLEPQRAEQHPGLISREKVSGMVG